MHHRIVGTTSLWLAGALMAPGLAWAQCPASYTVDNLLTDLTTIEASLRSGDDTGAAAVAVTMEKGLPCLDELIPVMIVGRAYRAVGAGKAAGGDEDGGKMWFRTATEIEQSFDYGLEDLPADHPVRGVYAAAKLESSGEVVVMDEMYFTEGNHHVDGRPVSEPKARLDRFHLYQMEGGGQVMGWVITGNGFPPDVLRTGPPMVADADAGASEAEPAEGKKGKKKKKKGGAAVAVATAPAPAPAPVMPEPAPEPEPVAVAPEPEPEPVAVAPEPEPEPVAVAPEPEPEPVAVAPEPEPPAPAPAPEPEPPAPEPPSDDAVAQAEPAPEPEPSKPAKTKPEKTKKPKAVAPAPTQAPSQPMVIGRKRPWEKTPLMIGGGLIIAGAGGVYAASMRSKAQFDNGTTLDEITRLQAATNQLVLVSAATFAVGAGTLTWGVILDGGQPVPAVRVRF